MSEQITNIPSSTQYYTFGYPPNELILEHGQKLGPITVAYETYGTMNSDRSNVILICHALSGDAHVARGNLESDEAFGWWEDAVGPGKIFDTLKYFIICSNVLGGCKGTTGPTSINPKTSEPYALDFPLITIKDMVEVQRKLIEYLQIKTLFCIVGGSMGGMQVIQWIVSYPELVESAIVMASTAKHSALAIALNYVGRQSIINDPYWSKGNYYRYGQPRNGMSVARMIGHISYLSESSMEKKFGRNLLLEQINVEKFTNNFQIESYLKHQGEKFVNRFDANSYLYITQAIDNFDLERDFGSLTNAFKNFKGKVLVLSFTSDWLYPTHQSLQLVSALKKKNIVVLFFEIKSESGND